jgi:hypothetical protein
MKLLALANLQNSMRTAGGFVRGFRAEKTRPKISSGFSKKIALWTHTLLQNTAESGCAP